MTYNLYRLLIRARVWVRDWIFGFAVWCLLIAGKVDGPIPLILTVMVLVTFPAVVRQTMFLFLVSRYRVPIVAAWRRTPKEQREAFLQQLRNPSESLQTSMVRLESFNLMIDPRSSVEFSKNEPLIITDE